MAAPTPPPDHGTDETDPPTRARRPRDDTPTHEPTDDTIELVTLVDDTTNGERHTICPADGDATDLITTWLTVDATIVCDLDDWR